jgi:NAD(P)-dependent dehydrogenase (short-subunit alcohol dehydrogenase family)
MAAPVPFVLVLRTHLPMSTSEVSPPVAIVTGAGSGVGRAVTVRLIESGYRVVLAGRRTARLEEVLACTPGPAESFALPVDVRVPDSVDALFDEVVRRAGRIDLLVNNAGTFGRSDPVQEYSVNEWVAAVETNLTGAFLCARRAFRQMIEQDPSGGRIINNGSISAHVPRPNAVAYTATKHGITGLTKALALEGRRHRIACGQIDIGNAATEMTEQMSNGVLQADGSVRPEPTIPVSLVADAVLYMAGLPLEANVLSLTVMATGMPFVGRG